MGFERLGAPFLGGFDDKDCSTLGSILAPPFYGSYRVGCQ